MIRGEDVNRALAILRYSDKRASNLIEKCMRSAIANANEAAEKANVAIDPDDLWVKTAFVDRGPTKGRRRVRPAPQGRAYREQRHFCHVTILLSNDARPEAKGSRHGDGKAAAAKPAKLVENKTRKRGGAAAAPRAKRVAPRSEASDKSDAAARAEGEKKATKRAAKKKTKVDE
jgi:large subunit ribosomal protein L22